MNNKAMERKIQTGEAIDLVHCPRTEEGDYRIGIFEEDVDYCDSSEEVWIWSIGMNLKTGDILASTTSKFYQNPSFKCLWLR